MKKLLIYSMLCLVFSSGNAHAQLAERICEGHMPCSFEQFKVGVIDWFQKADTNHDGRVDVQEQGAVWQQYAADVLPACKGFQDITALKLNRLPTDDEIRKLFSTGDANGDGVIDAQEDQQATARINQTCQFLSNPQVQKLQQYFKQMQQGTPH